MTEQKSELQAAPCDLCGSSDNELFLRVSDRPETENRDLVKCKECGLVFISPRKIYNVGEKNYFDDHETLDIFRVYYDFISQWAFPPGRFLDIGCAAGYLIDMARANGWQAVGLEISDDFIEFAKHYLKLDVRKGTPFDHKFEDRSINVVALTEVIEHVPGPSSLLAELNRILNEEGILFLSTPNIDSKAFDRLGEKWAPAIDPERHLYYFNPDTLTRLLRKEGFEVMKLLMQFGEHGDENIMAVAAKAGHADEVRRRSKIILLSGKEKILHAARYKRLVRHWFFGPIVRLGNRLVNYPEEGKK